MSIPNDEQLLAAVKALRVKEPALARTKVLKQLKEENGWEYGPLLSTLASTTLLIAKI